MLAIFSTMTIKRYHQRVSIDTEEAQERALEYSKVGGWGDEKEYLRRGQSDKRGTSENGASAVN